MAIQINVITMEKSKKIISTEIVSSDSGSDTVLVLTKSDGFIEVTKAKVYKVTSSFMAHVKETKIKGTYECLLTNCGKILGEHNILSHMMDEGLL